MPQHIKDVGIIYDTSVHDIDTALWLFDEVPDVVFAIAGSINHEHEDFATIMLGFKDNKTATISSNWITPTRVRNFNAVCTDARIFSNFVWRPNRKFNPIDGFYYFNRHYTFSFIIKRGAMLRLCISCNSSLNAYATDTELIFPLSPQILQ